MVKRSLFLKMGGYKNIEFEDRDLWVRFIDKNLLLLMDHMDFVERLPRNFKQKLSKSTVEVYYALLGDFQQGASLFQILRSNFDTMMDSRISVSFVIRFSMIVPCYVLSKIIKNNFDDGYLDPFEFSKYMHNNTQKITEIIDLDKTKILDCFSNEDSEKIFFI